MVKTVTIPNEMIEILSTKENENRLRCGIT